MLWNGLLGEALNQAMLAERRGDSEAAKQCLDNALKRALLAQRHALRSSRPQEYCPENGNIYRLPLKERAFAR